MFLCNCLGWMCPPVVAYPYFVYSFHLLVLFYLSHPCELPSLLLMFLTAAESNSNESYNYLTEVIKLIYNRRQFVHFSSDYSKVQRL